MAGIWLFSLQAMPQQVVNTPLVDQQTYQLFLEKNWKELIETGNKALGHGIDFYYLRFRLGIAWYHQQNYQMAIHHLQKAYQANPNDPLLKEYFYYSLAFTNRLKEARIIASSMSLAQRQQLDISDPGWIERTDITYNWNFADNQDLTEDFTFEGTATDGLQFMPTKHSYFSINLLHPVSERISIYHGYTHINKTHFIYSRTNGTAAINPEAHTALNQYYVSVNALLAPGLNLVAAGHAVNIGYRVPAPTVAGTQRITDNDFLGALSLYKQWPYVSVGVSGYYATFNEATQLQGDGSLVLYPLGNLNLYSVSTFSLQRESTPGAEDLQRQVFFQGISGRIATSLWLEVFASWGNMQNMARYDGLVVFNTMDRIDRQLGMLVTGILSPHLGFSIGYSLLSHQSAFFPADAPRDPINNKKYNSHSISGGFSWNF